MIKREKGIIVDDVTPLKVKFFFLLRQRKVVANANLVNEKF